MIVSVNLQQVQSLSSGDRRPAEGFYSGTQSTCDVMLPPRESFVKRRIRNKNLISFFFSNDEMDSTHNNAVCIYLHTAMSFTAQHISNAAHSTASDLSVSHHTERTHRRLDRTALLVAIIFCCPAHKVITLTDTQNNRRGILHTWLQDNSWDCQQKTGTVCANIGIKCI